MTLREARKQYLTDLGAIGYTTRGISTKDLFLRQGFLYVVALCHPDIPSLILHEEQIPLLSSTPGVAIEPVLARVRAAMESVRYFNLAALVNEQPNLLPRGKRIRNWFLPSLAGLLSLQSLTKRFVEQLPRFSGTVRTRGRLHTEAQEFLVFCFERGWLDWNPHRQQRVVGDRVLETDFFGPRDSRWADYARAYLEYLKNERNLAFGGLDYCARKLKLLVQWLDTERVHDLQVSKLKAFIEYKRSQGVSDNTLSKYLACFRPFLDFLIRTKRVHLRDNPASDLRIKSKPVGRRQTLTEIELKTLIEFLESAIYRNAHPEQAQAARQLFLAVRDLALVLLFALCGLRLSEAARMGVDDLLSDKKSLRIHGKGNRYAKEKMRAIAVNRYVWKRLTDYLKLRGHDGQRYLWISWGSGRPLTISRINEIVHSRIKEAGLNAAVSPHGLRATCASLYVKKGMDPLTLKNLLGHDSLKTTMDSYTRLTEEELRGIWKKTNPLAGYDDE